MTETASAGEPRSYLRSNIVIVSFLATYTCQKALLSSQNEVKVSKEFNSSEKVPFDHPFFQMTAMYLGEFVFTIFYYLWMAFMVRASVQWSEIRFMQFLYPALCDFTENLLFVFGLSAVLPSLAMMSKAIAVPISALFTRWSILRLRKTFNWQ